MVRLCSLILLLLLIAFAMLGCDPGMTIRQVDEQSSDPKLKIQVPLSRLLIGENWFAPDNVTVTNLSQSPVKITNLELVSQSKTYTYKQVSPTKYPVTVPAGKTVGIPIWFDLDSGVSTVFKNKVELRLYYEDKNEKGVSSVSLIGGPLD